MAGSIQYQTHIQNIGWQGWTQDGGISGTSGRALRLEAIRIKLSGNIANYYDVYYRVHAQKFGWLGWASNGQDAGTSGYGYRLEGRQVVLVPKGQPAPGSTANPSYTKADNSIIVVGSDKNNAIDVFDQFANDKPVINVGSNDNNAIDFYNKIVN
ncbi:hypothetical protein [Leuconostoc lactis]|uniref:hypothetical protein n=1 Tax=Leuconostoc lactis TaxID=1246 RepID=UPI0022E698E9|nr:hypothetical protein [Leuconostoc lactis]